MPLDPMTCINRGLQMLEAIGRRPTESDLVDSLAYLLHIAASIDVDIDMLAEHCIQEVLDDLKRAGPR